MSEKPIAPWVVIRCVLCPQVERYSQKAQVVAAGWRNVSGIGQAIGATMAGVCPTCAQARGAGEAVSENAKLIEDAHKYVILPHAPIYPQVLCGRLAGALEKAERALEKAERERDEANLALGVCWETLKAGGSMPPEGLTVTDAAPAFAAEYVRRREWAAAIEALARRMAVELQYVQLACVEGHSRGTPLCASAEGVACINAAERLFGPMKSWPEVKP